MRKSARKKINGSQREAAVPDKGTAAFFHSTPFRGVPVRRPFPAMSRQTRESSKTDNLWPKKHYFRLDRVDEPMADVVLIEGQIKALHIGREVSA